MATVAVPKIHKNFINGEWVEARAGRSFENRNPADHSELIGIFPSSIQEDVNDAVDAAKSAFAKWRLVPAPRRAEILYRAAETLVKRKEDLARDMTPEMRKPLSARSRWTRAEVSIEVGGWPARSSPPDSAIEKQPAWAAPISSSGFVPVPSSKREEKEY